MLNQQLFTNFELVSTVKQRFCMCMSANSHSLHIHLYFSRVHLNYCISAGMVLVNSVASYRWITITTKPAVLKKHTLVPWVQGSRHKRQQSLWGVNFESLWPAAKERKKNQRGGGINDKYLCLLFSNISKKKKKILPCGALNVELCLGPTSRQAAVASTLYSVSLALSSFLWCVLPRPLVQSKVGSLFMCKFAHRPYEGGAHAESLLSGL